MDDQNVPIIENFFYNRRLQDKLISFGYWRDAVWLKVIGEAYQAFEMSELTHSERSRRVGTLRQLLAAIFHTDLHDMHVNHATSRAADGIGGFPRKALLILMECASPCLYMLLV